MMIKICDLILGYHGYEVGPCINGFIKQGSMVAITGSNGIGKSTFLKTLAGLLSPISGKLKFKEKNKPSISYLPQKKSLNCYFPVTVFDIVSMGCWPKINFFKKLNTDQKYLIWSALEQVKLLNLLHTCIDSLSGGQFQRMLFARILVQRSSLILLDEPFQGVDNSTFKILINSIQQLHESGCTIIAVLHNYDLISKYFSDNLLLTHSSSVWKNLLFR